jgi:hypothetical protein
MKGIAVGIGAGLLCLIVGVVGADIVVRKHALKHEEHAPTAVPPTDDKSGDVAVETVETSETVISETVSEIPYLPPISLAVVILTSAWTYRRLRRSDTPH